MCLTKIGKAVHIAVFLWVFLDVSLCLAQPEVVARSVSEARRNGDEAALVHLAEEVGHAGIGECLDNASRAWKVLCAQSARYLESPWPVLPKLIEMLGEHDRQLSSRAAESLVQILSSLQPGDLGAQEPIEEEAQSILQSLRELSGNRQLSPDIRAQIIVIFGGFARLVGAAMDVVRDALEDPEIAVRRAAVSALMGSRETEDIQALTNAASESRDLWISAFAAAGVCEATLAVGRALPSDAESVVRQLMTNERARPSIMSPLLTCIAQSRPQQSAELRRLAGEHPHSGTRTLWLEQTSGNRR